MRTAGLTIEPKIIALSVHATRTPLRLGKKAARRGGLLDEMSFARGLACLLACRRLRVGDAAFDHAVALGDDLPVPAAVSAGHDPKFDIWLRRAHDPSPAFRFTGSTRRLSVAPHAGQRKARSPGPFPTGAISAAVCIGFPHRPHAFTVAILIAPLELGL
jgi:hypothetical protein